MNSDRIKIHFIYVVSILTFISIITFSYNSYWNADLIKLIEFSATLISIILAILAIFITIYYSSGYSGNIKLLDEVAQKIDRLSTETTKNIETATNKLEKSASEICTTSESVQKRVDLLSENTHSIGTRLDEISGQMKNHNNVTSENQFPDSMIDKLLNTASTAGKEFLIAIYICNKNTKKISLHKLAKIEESDPKFAEGKMYYFVGFASALMSVNLIWYNQSVKMEDDVLTFIFENITVQEDFLNKIESIIYKTHPESFKNEVNKMFNEK